MSDGTTSDGAVDGRDALLATARAWRDQDPDDRTRAELDAVITRVESGDDAAAADLADRFAGRLQFGTAGLRGALGAGSNRMNRVLVAQAAAGFAAFLLGREAEPSIVIGYDGRTNSDVFARDTAEIMAAAGVAATILPRALPTPVLAFAVRHLDVSAGVMVTASHNPPQDNGYKVYLGGVDRGSQIVSPVDGEIAAEIERAAAAPVTGIARSDDYREAGDDLVMEYVRRTAAVAGTAATGRQPRVVYTALHGVGWEVARRVFATAGFAEPIPVSEQSAPDAAFPTVAFPNPEEPGAMDLSFATADRVEADLIIANDPDADRLAVAIPVDGGWRRLSGNEVGSLLGWRAAERAREADVDGTLAASIVSSPALREIARVHGLDYVDTLTGFKWVSRVGGLLYGYEEALGYLVDPDVVRDKDGISAAVDLLALATELHTAGSSLAEHLVAFDERFGAYASSQVSIRVDDLATISALTARLRRQPPAAIGSRRVDRVDDFRDGFGAFPAGDILRYWLTDGSRVIVRPSGTEPKLKVYIDASSTEGDARARRASAEAAVADLESGMRGLLA
ncbi:phospho-sugar mutase [Frigoribacterium faeni]|uniref:Phosphomannomutase n=1 Tax=Frigoribacterium faeni TaxID=145483 RepID=A0A7W3JGB3_9MICO|nr:phospho-sugar mutase [Frigoribacterium faeni]MBA8812260.1 phosphomannomutase [Frigoribacterium faeni]GEK83168.1 phosphomannomutase [Frigoribacterium faeni]